MGFGGLRWVRAVAAAACAALVAAGAAPVIGAAPAQAAPAAPLAWAGPAVLSAAATGTSPSPVGPPESAESPPASLPPELVALEGKMEGLEINTEQVAMHATMRLPKSVGGLSGILTAKPTGKRAGHGRRPHGHAGRSARRRAPRARGRGRRSGRGRSGAAQPRRAPRTLPLLDGTGRISASPKEAVLNFKLLGALPVEARVVGEHAYLRESLLSHIDHGRPWLAISPAELEQQQGLSGAPGVLSAAGEGGLFGGLVRALAHAGAVDRVGTATVDGQQTTEFAARLDAAKLLREQLAKEPNGLPKHARKLLRGASATLGVYIEPDGLPVRMSFLIGIGPISMAMRIDIVATEVPVSVQAPPASETITEAELTKLARSQKPPPLTRRQQRRLRRYSRCVGAHLRKRARRLHGSGVLRRALRRAQRKCRRLKPGPSITVIRGSAGRSKQ